MQLSVFPNRPALSLKGKQRHVSIKGNTAWTLTPEETVYRSMAIYVENLHIGYPGSEGIFLRLKCKL